MLWPKYIFLCNFPISFFAKIQNMFKGTFFFSVSEWLTDTSNKVRNANIWKM